MTYKKIETPLLNKLGYEQVNPENCYAQFEREDGDMTFVIKAFYGGDIKLHTVENGEEDTEVVVDFALMYAIVNDFAHMPFGGLPMADLFAKL